MSLAIPATESRFTHLNDNNERLPLQEYGVDVFVLDQSLSSITTRPGESKMSSNQTCHDNRSDGWSFRFVLTSSFGKYRPISMSED